MKDGCMAKPGWFPADHVVLIDNSGKCQKPVLNFAVVYNYRLHSEIKLSILTFKSTMDCYCVQT